MQETCVQSLGWEDPLEKGMTTHFSILAWRIPWTEEPGGLQSIGSQLTFSPLAALQTRELSLEAPSPGCFQVWLIEVFLITLCGQAQSEMPWRWKVYASGALQLLTRPNPYEIRSPGTHTATLKSSSQPPRPPLPKLLTYSTTVHPLWEVTICRLSSRWLLSGRLNPVTLPPQADGDLPLRITNP